MSAWEIWLVIALLVLATVISRSTFWLVGDRIKLPAKVQEALRYAPACALAAVIVPDLLSVNGQLQWDWHNPKLFAGIAATVFFLIKKDMLLTIFFGMVIFTCFRLWL